MEGFSNEGEEYTETCQPENEGGEKCSYDHLVVIVLWLGLEVGSESAEGAARVERSSGRKVEERREGNFVGAV